ncbi:hypothetical protein L6164_018521 [Bauhinia variegata]|uniref:Uncharacterized protein n=1 Tax=Bauhinia variegata TaxID=167791 RepID=A0ACB9NCU6_BAUVA|nr:hypothetical protein L6164_018521 [Bauhinia variegata]
MESTKSKSRKNNKRKGKRGFFLCFKPTTLDDPFEEASRRNRANRVLKYFAVKEKKSGVGLPTKLSSALSTDNCTREACSCKGRRKKNDDHCSFWQALKTAWIDAAKKNTKKKTAKQKLCRTSRESVVSVDDKFLSPKHDSLLQREGSYNNKKRTHSNASSSFCCSSAFTASSSRSTSSTLSSHTLGSNSSEMSRSNSISLPSNASTGVTNFKKEDGVKESVKAQGRSDNSKGLLLLMFSLLVLTLCGKFCAILCTSIWLLVVPRRSSQSNQPAGFPESKLDSVQYRKKIIMEGLLDRNRGRVNIASMAKP